MLRFFLGDDERSPVLQTAPGNRPALLHPSSLTCSLFFPACTPLPATEPLLAGVFDERVAAAVDLVISEAAAHGIRVTPVLLNQWKKNNGVPQFEEW